MTSHEYILRRTHADITDTNTNQGRFYDFYIGGKIYDSKRKHHTSKYLRIGFAYHSPKQPH